MRPSAKERFAARLRRMAFLRAPLLAAGAFSLALAACSNGDGGGGAPAINPYLYGANGCVGCASGSTLGAGMGQVFVPNTAAIGIELELQFFAATGTYAPAGSGYITQVGYGGQIGASGFLNIYVSPLASCPIAPGRYPIQTAQAGQLSGNSVYGLIMQGAGLAVSLANGYISQAIPSVQSRADGAVFANKVVGRLQILPSGTYCQGDRHARQRPELL